MLTQISVQISAQNQVFPVPNLDISILAWNLQLDRFKDTNVKYDYIIFNFQPKNTHKRHFWFQI